MSDGKSEIIRFSVSLPANLLQELDSRITHTAYQSRSELVRDLIREKLVDSRWEGEGGGEDFLAVLVLVYDHHYKALNQRLNEIQHNSPVHILCATHVHIDSHNCLETIVLRGEKEGIEDLSLEIGGLVGVKFCKLTRTSSFAL